MIPSSGLNPCASAAGPPPLPLTSAYDCTAWRKACPTSGPSTTSNTIHARELASSRRSLSNSSRHAPTSRERKKDLLDVGVGTIGARAELVERAFADDASVAQQHESVANPGGIVQLVDREQQRSPARRDLTEHRANLSHLPEVESIERLVEQQQ